MYVGGWLDSLKAAGLSDKSVETRRRKMNHLARLLPMGPLMVTVDELTKVFAREDWKRETRHAYRSTLRSFYAWMCVQGYRCDNPVDELPKMRGSQPHPHPCPDMYIIHALGEASEAEELMLRLGSEVGLRRGEIARVHSSDVMRDLLGFSLIVHGKGDRQRIVPIEDDLAQRIINAEGYLFPGRFGGHVEESYIGKHVSRLLPSGWSAHSLRHRYATTAWEATHDLLLVSKLLGHASVVTTQVYVAMPDSRLREALPAVSLRA